MKKNLLFAALLPAALFAQDSLATGNYPDAFSSGSANVEPFTNKGRFFKDWSVSVGGGTALMQSADLTSFYDGKVDWGWSGYASMDKQISHAFGMSLLYTMGETNQKAKLPFAATPAVANTKFHQVSLLADVNLSNLLRRVDNDSRFNWALHTYVGVGLQGYKIHMSDNNGLMLVNGYNFNYTKYPFDFEQKLDIDSFFYELGTGLQYNINRLMDVEARVMYIISGDETIDGGGMRALIEPYNQIHPSHSDNFFTATLGLSFKLGQHPAHLRWFDPLNDAGAGISALEARENELIVCKNGDADNDGVCDDWDRQLDTPAGARVDGAGVALDMDLDTVIDLYDKCVTVPGPVENQGCPTGQETVGTTIDSVNEDFQGIEFELNSDRIRPVSFDKLNHAADIIKSLGNINQFYVIGATDTRGSEKINQDLSQRRAAAVVKYLNGRGVDESILIAEGHGKNDLKYPECDPASKCPEWKNEANRRVYFKKK